MSSVSGRRRFFEFCFLGFDLTSACFFALMFVASEVVAGPPLLTVQATKFSRAVGSQGRLFGNARRLRQRRFAGCRRPVRAEQWHTIDVCKCRHWQWRR